MKKLFLGSIALTLFSISFLLIQFSCGDKVTANPTSTQQQQGKILFTESNIGGIIGIWITNYDGANKIQVPVPSLLQTLTITDVSISPDGQTIFVLGYDANNGNKILVYSISTTGTNTKLIVDSTPTNFAPTGIQAY